MDPQEEILRGANCPNGLDWGANWGLEPEERMGHPKSRVNETPRKVETERGDYRGFYANVRDGRSKREPGSMFRRSRRCVRCAPSCLPIRAAAKAGKFGGWKTRSEIRILTIF